MTALPGQELLEAGLPDLAEGRLTPEALLLLIGARRLTRAGIPIPERPDVPDPEGLLYHRLCAAGVANPHGLYLSLIRRLESLERAAEHRRSRARREP